MESTCQKSTTVGKHKTSLPAPGEVNTDETAGLVPSARRASRHGGQRGS
jgi:hypothetical protein